MDKAQALQYFWSLFDIPAYSVDTIPDDAKMPYITYEVATADFEDGNVPLFASLWYFGTSWADISQKADKIAEYIGYGGITIKTNDGYIWIKRRTPFAQRMSDENDNIRRILIGIAVEYL
jgi:hypothetical protein